jgi:hypothetical protein
VQIEAFLSDNRPTAAGSGKKRTVGAHFHKTGATYQPNGARECARRWRQIATSQLRAENGFWRP